MDGIRRKCGQADSDVLRAFVGSGVLNPLSRAGDDGLSGLDVEGTVLVPDAQAAMQHHSVFLEFGRLARFLPACRAAHVSYADAALPAVQAADIFINDLGQITSRLHAGRMLNQCWQGKYSLECGSLPGRVAAHRGDGHLLIAGRRLEKRSILSAFLDVSEFESLAAG